MADYVTIYICNKRALRVFHVSDQVYNLDAETVVALKGHCHDILVALQKAEKT